MNAVFDPVAAKLEYERLFQWRDAWTRLANDRVRMRRLGGLQRTQDKVGHRAVLCNRRIAKLMREFEAYNTEIKTEKPTTPLNGEYAYHMGRSEYECVAFGPGKPKKPLFGDLPAQEQAKWVFLAGQKTPGNATKLVHEAAGERP